MRHCGGGNLVFADGHAKWYKGPDPWHRRSWAPVTWIKYSGTPCSTNQASAPTWYYPISGEAASGCDTTDTSP